jgi:hypothetical protein
MTALPEGHFDAWTLEAVARSAADEPLGVMPGSGRRVLGRRRKLLEAMHAADVKVAGDLPGYERDHHLFTLVLWPE